MLHSTSLTEIRSLNESVAYRYRLISLCIERILLYWCCVGPHWFCIKCLLLNHIIFIMDAMLDRNMQRLGEYTEIQHSILSQKFWWSHTNALALQRKTYILWISCGINCIHSPPSPFASLIARFMGPTWGPSVGPFQKKAHSKNVSCCCQT